MGLRQPVSRTVRDLFELEDSIRFIFWNWELSNFNLLNLLFLDGFQHCLTRPVIGVILVRAIEPALDYTTARLYSNKQ